MLWAPWRNGRRSGLKIRFPDKGSPGSSPGGAITYGDSPESPDPRLGVLLGAFSEPDSELRRLLELWPRLSDRVRSAILSLVSASFEDVHGSTENQLDGTPETIVTG